MPLPPCSVSLSLCAQKEKGASHLPGGRKEAGVYCLPRVSSLIPSLPPPCLQHLRFLPVWGVAGSGRSLHSIPPDSVYPGGYWCSCHDHQPWAFFVLEGNAGSCCWMRRHSVCFLIVPSAHKEQSIPMKAALCGPSAPRAEMLRCRDASPCQPLPPQQFRVGNRTSAPSPASKCQHMLTSNSPIVRDGIEQWAWTMQLPGCILESGLCLPKTSNPTRGLGGGKANRTGTYPLPPLCWAHHRHLPVWVTEPLLASVFVFSKVGTIVTPTSQGCWELAQMTHVTRHELILSIIFRGWEFFF